MCEYEDAGGGGGGLVQYVFICLIIRPIYIYMFSIMHLYHHFNLFCTPIFMEMEKRIYRVSVRGHGGRMGSLEL